MISVDALFERALPEGWEWKTMGDIADVVSGGTPKTSDAANFDGGNVPWLTPADLSGYTGKFVARGARLLTEKGLQSCSAKLIPKGAVLFTSRAPIGYVAIASNPISTNQGFKNFVLRGDVLPEYVYWWLKGAKQLAESLASGTTFLEISGSNAKKLPIPIAPLSQQAKIVAEIEKQFSRLDEAVANLQRVKANLKRYKAAVLKAAVEGRLVETEGSIARREGRTYETGEQLLQIALIERRKKWDRRGLYVEPTATTSDDLRPVPEGWIWATVEQLGFVRGGKRLPAGHKYADEVTPHPYIRVTDFADYGVNLDGLLYLKPETHKEIQRYTISSDDLYISIAGSIGLVGVLPERLAGANLTENAAKITGLEHVSKEYLMYWLSSASGIYFISDSTIATTQAKLALYRIERIPVPLPPLTEQTRIVAEVDRHLSIVHEVESEVDTNLRRTQTLRGAVLSKSFCMV